MLIRLLMSMVLVAFAVGSEVAGQVPSGSAAPAAHAVASVQVAAPTPPPARATPRIQERAVVVPPVAPSGQVHPTVPPTEAGAVVASDASEQGRVSSGVVETIGFQTVGITWPGDADGSRLGTQVRTRSAGVWSDWQPLPVGDAQPDPGSPEARKERGGTDPLWVGDADAVQLSFAATPEGGPAGLDVALVSSTPSLTTSTGDSPAGPVKSQPAVADARSAVFVATAAVRDASVQTSAVQPQIISRAEWGAQPQACTPDVASTLVAAVVHHTADSNSYSTVAAAEQQIRNDQAYHIHSRGWCDIGYNFIVDKWGNIYEGRANSLTQPVIGVHAGGFNTKTVGIAMLGDHSTITPSAATQEAVARIAAYRLAAYHRDPGGTVSYTTWGGETDRWAAGTTITMNTISGHRDVDITACPGDGAYAVLGPIRARAQALARPSFLNPSVSPTTGAIGSTFTVRAPTLGNINWTLTVADDRTGVTMSTSIGNAQQAYGGAVAAWDGRFSGGAPVGPGPYRMTLTGTDASTGSTAVPFSAVVQVTGSQNPPTVEPVPVVGNLHFVPITPQRLLDTRPTGSSLGAQSRTDLVVAGVAGIPANAKAVALNVTSVHASAVTFLRVWPAGQPAPNASIGNTDPNRTTNTGTMVAVGGEGKVSIYNNAGSVHLVVDVTGYYTDAAGTGIGYESLAKGFRLLDTRQSGGPLRADTRRTVQAGGVGGIPAGAQAVLANVSSVTPSGGGNINAFPSGGAVPTSASVNHLPGQNVSNRVVIPLDSAGRLDLLLQGAPADVVVDVVGWYGASAGSAFTPIVSARAVDTRSSTGPLSAAMTRTLSLASTGLPTTARVALISVAATQQTAASTFVTVWPVATDRPVASDLNTGSGRDQANATAVAIGAEQQIQAYNDAGGTQLVIDVMGYFG